MDIDIDMDIPFSNIDGTLDNEVGKADMVGAPDGNAEEVFGPVGSSVGFCVVGGSVGRCVGSSVGSLVGCDVGLPVGSFVRGSVGR